MRYFHSTVVIYIFIILLLSSTCNGYLFNSFTQNNIIEEKDNIVLVTGFGPFGTHKINPSQYISENLSGITINNASIIGMTLPVNYSDSVDDIIDAIEEYDPILVISLGLAASYKSIEIEKFAWNLKIIEKINWPYYKIKLIDSQGPLFRVSNLPCLKIIHAIKEEKISVRSSIYGGIYICNALQYNVLGYINENNLRIKAGFIHVPLLDSQNPEGMPLGEMINAVTIAIQESLDNIYL